VALTGLSGNEGAAMSEGSEAFVGLDTSKTKISVAVADGGRCGEVRFYGDIDSSPDAMNRLVKKLSARYQCLHFCYEAGPCGYGLHRQLTALGHQCDVVAPSMIPIRPGDRIKTNRRDAITLARLHRAGELTPVWVPDEAHEAVRDLVRARAGAMLDLRMKRQQLTAFLLRHDRIFPGRKTWSRAHVRWLCEQRFEHPAHQIVMQEYRHTIDDAETRLDRLEGQLAEVVPQWSIAPVVEAFQAMRGVGFLAAVIFVAEVGDVRRFESPSQLMGYLGLVPSERSTGDRVRRGGITKAGNRRARWVLIEGAWTYRLPARVLAGPPGWTPEGGAGYCLEGADTPVWTLSAAHGGRQEAMPGDHGGRPRDGGLPMGDRPAGGATLGGLTRKCGKNSNAEANAEQNSPPIPAHRWRRSHGGESSGELCGRHPSTPADR